MIARLLRAILRPLAPHQAHHHAPAWQPTIPDPFAAQADSRHGSAIAIDPEAYRPGPHDWAAMPGNRLELGSTGFYIALDLSPRQPLYKLHSPEHAMYAWGFDLPALKATGERYAREREEFVCAAPLAPWQAHRGRP